LFSKTDKSSIGEYWPLVTERFEGSMVQNLNHFWLLFKWPPS